MTEIQRILLSNIKKYRSILNYTQFDLAGLCEVSTSYISEIETGKKFPSAKTLESIVKALQVKPYRLFLDENDRDDFDKEGLLDDLKEKLTHQVASEIDQYYGSKKQK
ncbi:MAG: helix-turn-helix transcriptional regulator [Spirochaetia bacterium]|jgi:transcriptional regulator with XRE-family HTH domain|nr:helix-turn-helix transcriptional regulator [Spirochaetia bacterium]